MTRTPRLAPPPAHVPESAPTFAPLTTTPPAPAPATIRLAVTRTPHSAPPPILPITPPPVAATTTFGTHLRHLYTRPPHHATPLVVEVPFAKGKEVRLVYSYHRVLGV
jgi:hypothetical protein